MIYLKHLRYLIIHKWHVFWGCAKYGLFWQGLIHDWHKMLPDEMIPYARYIYGNRRTIDIKRAILTHINRARHHWQYWVYPEPGRAPIPLEMPRKYVLEMVADMKGAAKAKHQELEYLNSKDNFLLHKNTRKLLEQELFND